MALLVVATHTMRSVLAAIGAAVLVAGTAGRGHAALPFEAVAPTDERATIYVIEAPGTDPQLLQALDAARARLRGQGLDLAVASPPPDQTAAARARALVGGGLARGVFWFDERASGEIRVFLLTADGSAYVRRVPVEPSSAEASREAVWLIVEAAGLALASGQQVAMEQATELEPAAAPEPEAPQPEPEPKPAAVPAPTPTEPPPRRAIAWVGLGYLGEGLATAIPWSSGVSVGAALDLGRRWRLALDYGVLMPWRSGAPPVTWRHRGELRGGPRGALGERVELYALVGGGIDAMRWRATVGDDTGVRAVGVVTLDGGLGLRLFSTVWLGLEPGVGVALNRFDFVECEAGARACEGARRRVVLAPWRVRPRARLGLRVRF